MILTDALQKKTSVDKSEDKAQGDGASGDFWSGWGAGGGGDKSSEGASSWGLPWGMTSGADTEPSTNKSTKVKDSARPRKKPLSRKSSYGDAELKSNVADVVESTGQGFVASSKHEEDSLKDTLENLNPDVSAQNQDSGWQDFSLDQGIDDMDVSSSSKKNKNVKKKSQPLTTAHTQLSTTSTPSTDPDTQFDDTPISQESVDSDSKQFTSVVDKEIENVDQETTDVKDVTSVKQDHESEDNSILTSPQKEDSDIIDNISSSESQLVQEDIGITSVQEQTNDDHLPDVSQEFINISSLSSETAQSLISESSSDLDHQDVVQPNSDNDLPCSRTSSDLEGTGSSDTSKFDSSIETVVDRSSIDVESGGEEKVSGEDGSYSLFGEEEQKEELNKSDGSVSSSYVKCMIEEAMEDSKGDSGSDNHSNGEKSESSKVDSELEKSLYSGDGSSDDVETTTSSDIEILQAPAPGEELKYHSGFDISPLKIALQKSAAGHNRSDSQSSSSGFSKAGDTEHPSPDRGEATDWRDEGKD